MTRHLMLGLGFLLALCGAAEATCPAIPYTFVTGQLIQAPQLNANFASLLNCSNTGVFGPASSVDGDLAVFSGTTGKLLADPGGAHLDTNGLNLAIGLGTGSNVPGYALEVQEQIGTTASHAAAAGYLHLSWVGDDVDANVYGVYGDLWYSGAHGNSTAAVKGNVYAYASSGSPSGSLPHQFFVSPDIGTLQYLAGTYGRPAIYLPGTYTYAAAIMADGLYNLPLSGSTVTHNTNLLVVPYYASGSSENTAVLIRTATCNPTCFDATFKDLGNTAMTFALPHGISLAVNDAGATMVNYVAIFGGTAGNGPTIKAGGSETNPDISLSAKGTGSVKLQSEGVNSIVALAPAAGVNNWSINGSATLQAIEAAAAGADTDITMKFTPKGAGVINLNGVVTALTSIDTPLYKAGGTSGIASCTVVTAGATITIKGGVVTAFTGC